jgi:hypothetical protein
MSSLENYGTGLWLRLLNSFIREYYQVVTSPNFEGADLAAYPRYTPPAGGTTAWTRIEIPEFVPTAWNGRGIKFPNNHANTFWRLIPDLEALGCDQSRLNDLRAWCALAWPGPAEAPNSWQAPAYALWRTERANWGALAWPDREPQADPDGDGVVNLLEYVFGTDATALTTTPNAQFNQQGRLQMRFTRPAGRRDVSLQGEYSTDLVAWSRDPALVSILLRTNADGTETVTLRAASSIPNQTRGFLRLNATAP